MMNGSVATHTTKNGNERKENGLRKKNGKSKEQKTKNERNVWKSTVKIIKAVG